MEAYNTNPDQTAPKLGSYCLQYRLISDLQSDLCSYCLQYRQSSDLQSDLCSYCLQYKFAQNISRCEEQTTI